MKDLTEGSVTKHLLHMSAFLAVSMLVQTLYLLADLYWVGHLGKEAIAAVGVAGNLTMIVLALTQMLGVGTTTLISQAAGRKDQPHGEALAAPNRRGLPLRKREEHAAARLWIRNGAVKGQVFSALHFAREDLLGFGGCFLLHT